MPDVGQDTEVVLSLKVETEAGQKAMRKLADETKGAGDAAEQAEKRFKAFADANRRTMPGQYGDIQGQQGTLDNGPRFNARDAAMRQLNLAERDRQITEERQRLAYGSTPWYRRGLPPGAGKMLGTAGTIGTIGYAAAAGLSQTATDLSERTGPTSEAAMLGMFTKNIAQGIPIIGGLFKKFEELGVAILDATSGLTSLRAAAQRAAEDQARVRSAFRTEQELRISGRSQKNVLGMESTDANTRAWADAAFAGSLTPDRLASYHPRVRFGEATEQTGALRMAADRAQFDLAAATSMAAERDRSVAEQRPRYDQAQAAYGASQKAADDAKTKAENLRRRYDATWIANPNLKRDMFEAGNQAREAGGIASDRFAGVEKEKEELQKRITDQQRAGVDLANAEKAAKQATLALDRDRLAIQKQILESTRQGMQVAGGQTRADVAQGNKLFEIAKSHGLNALTPEQIGSIEQIPEFQAEVQRMKEARARSMREYRRRLELSGRKAITEQERDVEGGQGLVAAIDKAAAKLDAETSQKIADATAKAFESKFALIEVAIGRGIAQAKVDGFIDKLNKLLFGKGQ